MATNQPLLNAPFTTWVATLSTAPACPMVEYGAELDNGTVYMHDASLTTVEDFIKEFGKVTPIHLVHRHVDGGTHGRWVTAKAGA